MNITQDDPRLTAYVLNELDPSERELVEQALQQDPELAACLRELENAARACGEALDPAQADSSALDPVRRESVLSAMAKDDASVTGVRKRGRNANSHQASASEGGEAWWSPWGFSPSWGWAGAAILIAVAIVIWRPWSTDGRDDGIAAVSEVPGIQHMEESHADVMIAEAGDAAPVLPQPELSDIQEALELADVMAPSEMPMDVMISSAPSASFTLPPLQSAANISTGGTLSVPSSGSGRSFGQVSRDAGGRHSTSQGVVLSGHVGTTHHYTFPSDPRMAYPGTETYDRVGESGFRLIRDAESATSTFSADVDTASYANVRRFLLQGTLPPSDAVRIEELLNYFSYQDREPKGDAPIGAAVEVASAPWNPQHRLVRIGVRARDLGGERKAMNLVFLVDVSGSMRPANRLPLVQRSLQLLTRNLETNDRIAIVTYSGSSQIALPSTPVSDRQRILDAIAALGAGGSTNAGDGIQVAYRTAREHFIPGGINRVILCTDGDFNVGVTNREELIQMIRTRSNEGIFLSIFGFGMGNLKDGRLEAISNEGNGTYAYIDSFAESQKAFGEQLEGTLATVAKDVKFQIEFNPDQVAAWRLIGYENRILAREDFHNDAKDAGDIGAGHSMTALYEIVPVGVDLPGPRVDDHRYIPTPASPGPTQKKSGAELFYLKIRYKEPESSTSKLMSMPVKDAGGVWGKASEDFRFAAAVAGYGMLLRGSEQAGVADWPMVIDLARNARGDDPHGHRAEFLRLAEIASGLQRTQE